MIVQTQGFTITEGLAIVLSVVSLVITVVGFFASLKFYRDGVELQRAANDALTKLEEKTEFIQVQVGGMFDKTLDAAIGKREILSEQFEQLNDQLEKTKVKLIEESIGQIGAAGEKERQRLSTIVDSQMALIQEKVDTTRESAEEMVEPIKQLAPSYRYLLAALQASPEGLTLSDIAKRFRFTDAGASKRVKQLVHLGLVEKSGDKYFPTNRAA